MFQFAKMGAFTLDPAQVGDRDELELDLIDSGLEELGETTTEDGRDAVLVRCAFADFGQMQRALEARGIEPIAAEVEYVPAATTGLPDDQADAVLDLVGKLEADEDVQRVFHNLA